MTEELKALVEEYVEQIEAKEASFLSLERGIEQIILRAQNELEEEIKELDVLLDEEKITEEEYLASVRSKKEILLEKTKEAFGMLVQEVIRADESREETSRNDQETITSLRKELGIE